MVKFIKCNLINIQNRKDRNIGTEFILQDKESKIKYSINVDESLERVKTRLKEQYNGDDEREGVFLSRCMTNINIDTNGEEWIINQDFNFYLFNREDILKFILTVDDLKVDSLDLIKIGYMSSGDDITTMLNYCITQIIEGKLNNNREELLSFLKE